MKDQVKKIVEAIMTTNTDYRGNLFEAVAIELKNQNQGYTGEMFFAMANTYGINKNKPVEVANHKEKCNCTHQQACKICGEEKGLDGDFWKMLKEESK